MINPRGEEAPRRIAALDVARGLALIGMGVYHFSWDLAYFGLAPAGLPYSPGMRVFSHVVASAFLGLAGVSLAIAHRFGPRWRAFLLRLLKIAGAAALVSLASYLIAPDEPIWFGILHCIAAASLLAAPLLGAPPWAALIAGAAVVAAPRLFTSAIFNPAALLWLGLGTAQPSTLDWRPLLPWAGATLTGLGLTRLFLPQLFAWPLALWRPRASPGRALAFAGRHSLIIYLIHQPILIGLIYAVTQLSGVAALQTRDRYIAACRPACVEAGGEIEACKTACECVASGAENAGLGASLASRSPSEADRKRLTGIVKSCGSEAP
jgi:uncharacterized membrane protein